MRKGLFFLVNRKGGILHIAEEGAELMNNEISEESRRVECGDY